ncbi:MAG: hypothetical protein M1834_002624 [Cirrosporium novae-zelandiae]|nr:MAG: hypothetical protein M1834_002624 [Cirrosporium novae-zelandiae]
MALQFEILSHIYDLDHLDYIHPMFFTVHMFSRVGLASKVSENWGSRYQLLAKRVTVFRKNTSYALKQESGVLCYA